MCNLEYRMTEIYCFVDDYLKRHPASARWRRSPNGRPRFPGAEVLTIAVLQNSFGCATLKQAYKLMRDNRRSGGAKRSGAEQRRARRDGEGITAENKGSPGCVSASRAGRAGLKTVARDAWCC
jgi:hypothetical protein